MVIHATMIQTASQEPAYSIHVYHVQHLWAVYVMGTSAQPIPIVPPRPVSTQSANLAAKPPEIFAMAILACKTRIALQAHASTTNVFSAPRTKEPIATEGLAPGTPTAPAKPASTPCVAPAPCMMTTDAMGKCAPTIMIAPHKTAIMDCAHSAQTKKGITVTRLSAILTQSAHPRHA